MTSQRLLTAVAPMAMDAVVHVPERLRELIAALGRKWGDSGLALDASGRAVLQFDGDTPLQLEMVCHGTPVQLQLRVELGALPSDPQPQLLMELLRVNRLGADGEGCCMVLADGRSSSDESTAADAEEPATLWWLENLPWRALDVEAFIESVAECLATAQDARQAIGEMVVDRSRDQQGLVSPGVLRG